MQCERENKEQENTNIRMQKGAIHFIESRSMAMKTNRGKSVAPWLAALAVVGGSFFFDDALIAFMKTHTSPAVLEFGRMGSYYGEWPWLMVPCAVAALFAWLRRDAACVRVICVMIIASTLAGIGADVVRVATGRTRPNATAPQGWYGPYSQGQWVAFESEFEAFPSAHAAAAMGLIAPLLLMRRRIGWLLLPVPALIGAARICAGAHHLSDVLAGALLGFAIACWVDWKIAPRVMRWRIFNTVSA
jgi:membrane-associated phospholipid phosphatase